MAKIQSNDRFGLKGHFSERRAMALVCKLEKYMMQLVQVISKVTELTNEYKNTLK